MQETLNIPYRQLDSLPHARNCLREQLFSLHETMRENGIEYALAGSLGVTASTKQEPKIFRCIKEGRRTLVDIDYLVGSQEEHRLHELKTICDQLWENGYGRNPSIELSPVNLPPQIANDPGSVLPIKWEPGYAEINGVNIDHPSLLPIPAVLYGARIQTLNAVGQILLKLPIPKSPLRYTKELKQISALASTLTAEDKSEVISALSGKSLPFFGKIILSAFKERLLSR